MTFDKPRMDLSEIEPAYIRENHIVGLGFPSSSNQEYVAVRCISRQRPTIYYYDPIAENMISAPIPASTSLDGITNHGFQRAQRPNSQFISGKPNFVFVNDTTTSASLHGTGGFGELLQIFFGVSPSYLRVSFEQPVGTPQISLPIAQATDSYNQFGAIPGSLTPIEKPGTISEVFVPPRLDFALGFYNDIPDTASPLFAFIVNRIKYQVIVDPDILYEVLNTSKFRSLHTVGGLTPFQYNIRGNFGVEPLTLGMNRSQIKSLYAKYNTGGA
ncbi:MAG: hypothetical protein ACYDAO_04485 [Thermoplasmataceae archaeon]